MPERKYAKYIMTDPKPPPPEMAAEMAKMKEAQIKSGNYVDAMHLLSIDSALVLGGFYTDVVWFFKQHGTGGVNSEIPHAHDFDEIWIFIGTVPGKPRELGGELDFWLDDEEYIVDKSCMVYIPKGLKHGPCGTRKIESPIMFVTIGTSAYTRSFEDKSVKLV
jgi:mannose-6-phosphate isomerase-like protein (cupin superfamily)